MAMKRTVVTVFSFQDAIDFNVVSSNVHAYRYC